jgi:hypothetical protein
VDQTTANKILKDVHKTKPISPTGLASISVQKFPVSKSAKNEPKHQLGTLAKKVANLFKMTI